jgi:hypothetical protein
MARFLLLTSRYVLPTKRIYERLYVITSKLKRQQSAVVDKPTIKTLSKF